MGSTEIEVTYDCDVLVIGSGVSGYCAAIQAGRCGCDTILVEKDEVLGGNSGPNLGVGITGADRYNAYATETGGHIDTIKGTRETGRRGWKARCMGWWRTAVYRDKISPAIALCRNHIGHRGFPMA